MVVGVGIDLASISEIERLLAEGNDAFVTHTFSERERQYAEASGRRAEAYAGMFACKEAVFKAIAHTQDALFDLRRVEVLHAPSGMPYVELDSEGRAAMNAIGAKSIIVSITNEADFAMAVAIAQDDE